MKQEVCFCLFCSGDSCIFIKNYCVYISSFKNACVVKFYYIFIILYFKKNRTIVLKTFSCFMKKALLGIWSFSSFWLKHPFFFTMYFMLILSLVTHPPVNAGSCPLFAVTGRMRDFLTGSLPACRSLPCPRFGLPWQVTCHS